MNHSIRRSLSPSLVALALMTSLASPATADDTATPVLLAPHEGWSFADARLIPVQSGGRVKPFDTYARETVLYLTGNRTFEGWNSVDLAFSWISHPQEWDARSFIQVSRADVKRQLGLDENRKRFSPRELYANPALAQYADRIGQPQTMTQANPVAAQNDPRQTELRHVMERVGLFRTMVSGHAWLVVPKGGNVAWDSLAGQDPAGAFIRTQFVELVRAHQKDDQAGFERAATQARAAVEGELKAVAGDGGASREHLEAEAFYNRAHPFTFAWIFYLVAALSWLVSTALSGSGSAWTRRAGKLFTALALGTHVAGIALRCYIAGRPPVTNMYESVVWVALGVVVFSLILYAIHRQAIVAIVSCTMAMVLLMLGESAPAVLDPTINPLVPVLRSNFWLTIHVLTITLGYAAFALTLGLANVSLFQFIRKDLAASTRIASLNQLTYRAMQFGVVLIAAGTILGGVWADYSWGRFWGWDPKEVWALIVLLCYVAILHARFTGWFTQFSFAAWAVIAFLSVLMAWYGVNFILGVGLHSYGFSAGGRGSVAIFTLAQLAYVAVIAVIFKRAERGAAGAPPRTPANAGT